MTSFSQILLVYSDPFHRKIWGKIYSVRYKRMHLAYFIIGRTVKDSKSLTTNSYVKM